MQSTMDEWQASLSNARYSLELAKRMGFGEYIRGCLDTIECLEANIATSMVADEGHECPS